MLHTYATMTDLPIALNITQSTESLPRRQITITAPIGWRVNNFPIVLLAPLCKWTPDKIVGESLTGCKIYKGQGELIK